MQQATGTINGRSCGRPWKSAWAASSWILEIHLLPLFNSFKARLLAGYGAVSKYTINFFHYFSHRVPSHLLAWTHKPYSCLHFGRNASLMKRSSMAGLELKFPIMPLMPWQKMSFWTHSLSSKLSKTWMTCFKCSMPPLVSTLTLVWRELCKYGSRVASQISFSCCNLTSVPSSLTKMPRMAHTVAFSMRSHQPTPLTMWAGWLGRHYQPQILKSNVYFSHKGLEVPPNTVFMRRRVVCVRSLVSDTSKRQQLTGAGLLVGVKDPSRLQSSPIFICSGRLNLISLRLVRMTTFTINQPKSTHSGGTLQNSVKIEQSTASQSLKNINGAPLVYQLGFQWCF